MKKGIDGTRYQGLYSENQYLPNKQCPVTIGTSPHFLSVLVLTLFNEEAYLAHTVCQSTIRPSNHLSSILKSQSHPFM